MIIAGHKTPEFFLSYLIGNGLTNFSKMHERPDFETRIREGDFHPIPPRSLLRVTECSISAIVGIEYAPDLEIALKTVGLRPS